jgi:BASS family bile acid:Na+ symporter
MLAMGMSLTMAQILQPLRNVRLVLLALLANFVLTPLLAYVIIRVIPLEQSLQIGLVVLGTAQRNVAAAILVSVQNFSDTNTVSFVLVAAVLLLLVLLPAAKRMGARNNAPAIQAS